LPAWAAQPPRRPRRRPAGVAACDLISQPLPRPGQHTPA